MPNAAVVAAAVAVPVVLVGGGAAWWFFKGDRVVDDGETTGFAWRVRREGGKYVAEVKAPAQPGFAAPDWYIVPPASQRYDSESDAKNMALAHIAQQTSPAPGAGTTGPSFSSQPATPPPAAGFADQEVQDVTVEVLPAVQTVQAFPVAPTVQFVGGV